MPILVARDAAELELVGADADVEEPAAAQARSATTPGLVHLFLEMATAAPDPDDAAHAFFPGRHVRLRVYMDRVLGRSAARHERELAPVDAEFLARIPVAASDGLQPQWLSDPSIDREADPERPAGVPRRALD